MVVFGEVRMLEKGCQDEENGATTRLYQASSSTPSYARLLWSALALGKANLRLLQGFQSALGGRNHPGPELPDLKTGDAEVGQEHPVVVVDESRRQLPLTRIARIGRDCLALQLEHHQGSHQCACLRQYSCHVSVSSSLAFSWLIPRRTEQRGVERTIHTVHYMPSHPIQRGEV